jgi:Ctr copper transporter family
MGSASSAEDGEQILEDNASTSSMANEQALKVAHHFCTGAARAVRNGFQTSFHDGRCVNFLFEDAVLNTRGKYIAAVVGAFALAFVHEAVRFVRLRAAQGASPFSSCVATSRPIVRHSATAAIYGLQMLLSFWLILLVLQFETVLFAAIVAGLIVGYATFACVDDYADTYRKSGGTKGFVELNGVKQQRNEHVDVQGVAPASGYGFV